jgi:hypothetical protein
MELPDFLDLVITGGEGFFCFASGGPNVGGWSERWYRWPAQRNDILDAVAKTRGTSNVYFSSYLFRQPSSLKANVLPTRTIQADLDEASLDEIPIPPTVLVRTSPGRHQAYWVLDEALDLDAHEILSRKISYAIPKCDHSGWPLGRKIRIPETFNFKYLDGPHPVEVVSVTRRAYSIETFEALPEAAPATETNDQENWLDRATSGAIKLPIGPNELLETIKNKGLSPKTYLAYNVRAANRSDALWGLLLAAFRCGLDRDAVFWLAKHSANNKFAELKFHADRELAKDVLRAEATIRKSHTDPRDHINSLRRLQPAFVRKQAIYAEVASRMRERGSFLHAHDDSLWYVRGDMGRPVIVADISQYLDSILHMEYGLNKTETEHNYTAAGLVAYTLHLPTNAVKAALSYYDLSSNALLLHTGRKEVLRITPDAIDTIVDGANGIVFPWYQNVEPFSLGPPDPDWGETLFGHSAGQDALSNIIGLKREESLALLKIWFLFLLFRNIADSRPLLATFGQPGSGKSTLFKKVYALLYGRNKSIESITREEAFDHVVASDPFVVVDNVDTWKEWLPDRLALCAGTSDITRRKLYSDADSFILKRQAMVGISAHNPRFGREDVADRLLLFSFERLENFLSETLIKQVIFDRRANIWGGIVKDVQRVLATPIPEQGPQFRIEDFARVGLWFARALNHEREFISAIGNIRIGQRAFSLDEDRTLVEALKCVVRRQPIVDMSPTQLWSRLELEPSVDPVAFGRMYRSPVALGKKLLAMQEALRAVFTITFRNDSEAGKLWSMAFKDEVHRNGTT